MITDEIGEELRWLLITGIGGYLVHAIWEFVETLARLVNGFGLPSHLHPNSTLDDIPNHRAGVAVGMRILAWAVIDFNQRDSKMTAIHSRQLLRRHRSHSCGRAALLRICRAFGAESVASRDGDTRNDRQAYPSLPTHHKLDPFTDKLSNRGPVTKIDLAQSCCTVNAWPIRAANFELGLAWDSGAYARGLPRASLWLEKLCGLVGLRAWVQHVPWGGLDGHCRLVIEAFSQALASLRNGLRERLSCPHPVAA
jgi:hypothetical protein